MKMIFRVMFLITLMLVLVSCKSDLIKVDDLFYHKAHSTMTHTDIEYSQFEVLSEDIILVVAHVGNRDMYPVDLDDIRKRRIQQDIVIFIKTK